MSPKTKITEERCVKAEKRSKELSGKLDKELAKIVHSTTKIAHKK